jgi:hypothetical protein
MKIYKDEDLSLVNINFEKELITFKFQPVLKGGVDKSKVFVTMPAEYIEIPFNKYGKTKLLKLLTLCKAEVSKMKKLHL